MTINERVSPKRLAEIIARAEVCDDSVLTDYRDIESIARELQQYRAAAEPVAWQWFHLNQWHVTNDEERARELAWDGVKVLPLYAVPQLPQPVEPEITSEELDDELLEQLIDFRRSMLNHHRKEGNKVQTVMHGMVLRVMLELQERRAATLTAAPAVQAGQEPIYQLRDVDWYDTDKRTYDTVVNTGGAGRIVYAAPQLPQPAVVPDAIEIDDDFDSAFEHGKAVGWNAYRAAMLQGTERVSQPYTLPAHSPCADAPDHIWLQTAGEWPASGEFGELTWSCDNQHPDDTLYVRADLVGNSPVIPDGSEDMLRRWLSFGKGMQKAGSHLPRHLIAETEAMLPAAPKQEAE